MKFLILITALLLPTFTAAAHYEQCGPEERETMSDNFPVLTIQRKADAAIAARRILASTAVDGVLKQAASGADKLIAVNGASAAAAAGAGVEAHYEGVVPVEYGAVVEPGESLTSDATGRAVPAGPGEHSIGRANEAGGVGTIGSVVLAPAFVEEANTNFQNHLTSDKHRVAVPLTSFYEVDGTPLAAFADGDVTTPGLALDDGEAPGIRWNNHATPDPVCAAVPLPADLDDTADVEVEIVASKTGATVGDATTFAVGAFMPVVGGLRDADANAGGASSAMVGNAATKTLQRVSRTIAAADIPAGADFLALTLQPTDGTLGADDVTVHAVHLVYTPKLLDQV